MKKGKDKNVGHNSIGVSPAAYSYLQKEGVPAKVLGNLRVDPSLDKERFSITIKELAEKLGLKAVTVQSRVKELKKEGVATMRGRKWYFSPDAMEVFRSFKDGRGRPPSPEVKKRLNYHQKNIAECDQEIKSVKSKEAIAREAGDSEKAKLLLNTIRSINAARDAHIEAIESIERMRRKGRSKKAK